MLNHQLIGEKLKEWKWVLLAHLLIYVWWYLQGGQSQATTDSSQSEELGRGGRDAWASVSQLNARINHWDWQQILGDNQHAPTFLRDWVSPS